MLGKEAVFVELRHGKSRYRGEYRPKNVAPFEIEGEWKVTVESPNIVLPYARVREDPAARGLQERWFAQTVEDANWGPLWLSPMMRSIRRWNVIGPFPNPDDRGLEEAYAPETNKEIDYGTGYQGDEGQQLHWQEVNSADEWVGPPEHNGTIELVDGRYGPSSYIVNYGRVLRMSPARGTIYVQTNVYAPQGGEAVMVLGAPHPTAVFVNGDKTYSRWLRPLYFQFTDGFATRIPIKLQAGWNSTLIKFLHNPQESKPTEFTCRFEQPDGTPMEGLISSPEALANLPSAPARGYRWLRFAVPALAGGLRVPSLRRSWLAFVDGHQVPSASEIPFPSGIRTVTLRVAADEVLDHPFAFSTVPASLSLGTWKAPGLEHFSGTMTYEKTVEIPASLMSERVLLDCGEVGVCADAWINGKAVGSRPWAPYVFDVTEHLHPGKNQLKVRVANTEANTRAVGSSRPILEKIDLDGWHGPARLVPFVERDISCPLLTGGG
jgi:hypothetical protein